MFNVINLILAHKRSNIENSQNLSSLHSQYLATISDLNTKISSLTTYNHSVESDWKEKYQALLDLHNTESLTKSKEITELKFTNSGLSEKVNKLEREIERISFENESEITKLTETLSSNHSQEISNLKQQYENEQKEYQATIDSLKLENISLVKKLTESKDILKLSSESLTKKDKAITELSQKLNEWKSKVTLSKCIDTIQIIIGEEKVSEQRQTLDLKQNLEIQIEGLEYKNKDLETKLKMTQQFLEEKSVEYEKVAKQLNDHKKLIQT